MKHWILVFGLMLFAFNLNAGDIADEGLDPVPEPPVLPDPIESGEAIEPEVTIIRREDATIEEYRINGFLYAVKVVPAIGPPYYLMDMNGDGTMESRMNELENFVVPQWVIFRW